MRPQPSGRKKVMSMRELFCPDPLAGLKKWRYFKYFLPNSKMFPVITWKKQAICVQNLQAVVNQLLITYCSRRIPHIKMDFNDITFLARVAL